jgi:DNA-binding PadR family transcriptional regulator
VFLLLLKSHCPIISVTDISNKLDFSFRVRSPISIMDKTQSTALFRTTRDREPQSFLPLSTANLHILLALALGERHGYAIMQEVNETSEGTVKLGPGTLYRSIQALLEDDLIEESARRPSKDEDQRRRYYRLTALGRRVLAAESRRLSDLLALARSRNVLHSFPR